MVRKAFIRRSFVTMLGIAGLAGATLSTPTAVHAGSLTFDTVQVGPFGG